MTLKKFFRIASGSGLAIMKGGLFMKYIKINALEIQKDFVSIDTKSMIEDEHGNIVYFSNEAFSPATVFRTFDRAKVTFSRLLNAVAKRTECESSFIRWMFASYRSKRRRSPTHKQLKHKHFSQKRYEAVV